MTKFNNLVKLTYNYQKNEFSSSSLAYAATHLFTNTDLSQYTKADCETLKADLTELKNTAHSRKGATVLNSSCNIETLVASTVHTINKRLDYIKAIEKLSKNNFIERAI